MTAFDTARFDMLLTTTSLGRSLVYRDVVDSTMVLARDLAAAGAAHGTVVLAETQTAGRGRRGRSFYSPPGENLYFTLILRPSHEALNVLTLAVPVAVAEACGAISEQARIKWPNDIWIGERKCCGMLIDVTTEGHETLAFPGIGINVNGDPTRNPELADTATSLARETGCHVDREALLAAVVNGLEQALATPAEVLVERYRTLSNTIGRRVLIHPAAGDPFEGVAEGIAPEGSLEVRRDDGRLEVVRAGDVSLRPLS